MAILGGLGGILMLIGLVWTIITAFKMGGTLWGVLNIIICVQPIIGIVSAAMKKAEWVPVILMIIGSVLSGIGWSASITDMMNQMPR
ncbi:MAG: hypothetical protein WA584_10580 [Pyrinomonadaceae bacterium]